MVGARLVALVVAASLAVACGDELVPGFEPTFTGLFDEPCTTDDDCDGGLDCLPTDRGTTCTTPCQDDTECGTGVCLAEAAVCARTGAGVGSACSTNADCDHGLYCELLVDGGYCTAACDKDTPCPQDGASLCISLTNDYGTFCLSKCTEDADCREGVVCTELVVGGVFVCYPSL